MVMPRPFRLPLLMAMFALGLPAPAADPAPATPRAPEPTVFTDPAKATTTADPVATPTPARPRRDRVMSDDLAATLSVGMPKYSPPKPVEKKPVDVPADIREADKPKNGIIRLPDYVVREARPPVFQEKDLATTERKADLGMKRNAGLNIGPFSSLNRPIALAMYQEQERLDNMSELADDVRTARRVGDKTTADFISKQSQDTYLRRGDFAPTYGLGPK
jgi:hypothetical protein